MVVLFFCDVAAIQGEVERGVGFTAFAIAVGQLADKVGLVSTFALSELYASQTRCRSIHVRRFPRDLFNSLSHHRASPRVSNSCKAITRHGVSLAVDRT